MVNKIIDKFTVKFNELNLDLKEVLSKGAISFLFKAGGASLAFVFNILLAKFYGAEGVGEFFLMFSLLNVSAMFCRMGTDNILVRNISLQYERRNNSGLKQIVSKTSKLIFVTTFLLGLGYFIFSNYISAYVFGGSNLDVPIMITSISILPFTFMLFYTEVFKGIRNILNASFLKGFGIYLIGIILLLLLHFFPINLKYENIWVLFLSSALVAVFGLILWRYNIIKLKDQGSDGYTFPINKLIRESRPLWVSSMVLILSEHVATMLLGVYSDSDSVGIYGTCVRFGLLMIFCLDALNAILAPKFAQLFINDRVKEIENISKKAVKLTLLLTTPVLLILFFFSNTVLGLFGDEFIKGALSLKVIICAQFFNLLTGPVGYVLIMTHNEKIFSKVNVIAFIVLLILSLILIPNYSFLGASISYGVSIVLKNIMLLFYVKKKVGITTLPI